MVSTPIFKTAQPQAQLQGQKDRLPLFPSRSEKGQEPPEGAELIEGQWVDKSYMTLKQMGR